MVLLFLGKVYNFLSNTDAPNVLVDMIPVNSTRFHDAFQKMVAENASKLLEDLWFSRLVGKI